MPYRLQSLVAIAAIVAATSSGAPIHARQGGAGPDRTPPTGIDVARIADGVYAVIRREPLGFAVHGNSVFIVCDRDVVVIDTDFTREAARTVIAALRAITPKPVRFVINTHWHDDHVMGNQAYREAFPDVEFIAQTNTRAAMLTDAVANRQQQLEGGPAGIAQFKRSLDTGRGLGGGALSDDERAMLASSVGIFEQYLAEAPTATVVVPTITFDDGMTLYHGGRTIELHWFGPANTRGDAVIFLPDERIVVTGDLVVAPIPFTFNSYPREWVVALDRVRALNATTLVPGHGPVMRDDSYIRLVERLLSSATTQAEAAVGRRESLEQARKSIDLDEFRQAMAGDSPVRQLLFANFVSGPLIARAYAEAGRH